MKHKIIKPEKKNKKVKQNEHIEEKSLPVILKKDIKVNRIFFLSDVHIKNDPIHDDKYYSVFNKLFEEFKKRKINENDVVVITGDIMDCGYHLTPTAIKMAKYFYHNLTNLCPVFSVLGNHEFKFNLDSLTPIVNYHFPTKYENYFLLENKIYIYGNIAFGHTKFDSTIVTPCSEYNDDYTTIGLFHGIINGAKLDNDYNARSQFSLKDFKDYKYLACGDLHKHQYLNKNKTAFYIGSTIAQKINEMQDPHGFMILDIKKDKSELIEINNEYKMLEITDKITEKDIDEISMNTKYADIQLSYEKFNSDMFEKIRNIFEDKGITITSFTKKPQFNIMSVDSSVKTKNKETKLSEITNVDDLKNFFIKYIEKKHKIGNNKKFKETLTTLLDESDICNDLRTHRNIKLLSIEIKNILIFGETVLNIEQINGIWGLCETNSFGKSSLTEIISLGLFAKTPRCHTSNSFIRNGQNKGSIIIKIISNDVEYEIKRTFSRTARCGESMLEIKEYENKDKTKFKTYTKDPKCMKDSELIYKTDDELEKKINTEIITYKEIYQMMVISQGRAESFLLNDKKLELLFKMSNLSYLDKIATKCNVSIKRKRSNITSLLKDDVVDDFKDKKNKDNEKNIKSVKLKIKESIDKKDDDYKMINEKYNKINDEYNKSKENIIKNEERMKNFGNVDIVDDDFDNLKIDNDKLHNKKDELDDKNKRLMKTIKDNKKTLNDNKNKIKKYGNIDELYKDFENNKKQHLINLNKEINNLNKSIKECKYNVKKDDYNKYKKDIVKYENDLKEINNEIDKMIKKSKISNNIKTLFENYKEYFTINNEKEICVKTINMYNDVYKNIKKYDKNNAIKKDIDNKIAELKEKINEYDDKLNDMNDIKIAYENYDPDENIDVKIKKLYDKRDNMQKSINNTEEKIKDYDNKMENNKLEGQIKDLENEINIKQNEKMDDYDEYIKLNNENIKLERCVKDDELITEKNKNKINEYMNEIKENDDKISKIMKNKEDYDKYNEIKKEYDNILKKHKAIEKEYNMIKKEKDIMENNHKELDKNIIIANNAIKKCDEIQEEIDNLELICNSLTNDGLSKELITNIVDNLQLSLNEMCSYIGHEQIYIKLVDLTGNKLKKYDILISTDNVPDVANAGGFKSNIMELLFKLSFLKINSYYKCDYIVVDEIFDACSEENKKIAIKLVEFFKLQYKQMLLVSHNPAIINIFDKRLIIKKDEINGNTIVN